ncbi:hypothetical protein FOZ61_011041 [Perkinsus olseni]|uniref:Cilia- and flagella-associated protein 418 n=1 Tax=Perkinsus olseni TaxID=32597 RepID=A0A7J6M1M0_PEROL|nr:hypothetical protein FOZ61_011041 [Perkinsus olseni]KAF4671913.1 hypothetical protein FOL46_009744 [Perkinsus olseni]
MDVDDVERLLDSIDKCGSPQQPEGNRLVESTDQSGLDQLLAEIDSVMGRHEECQQSSSKNNPNSLVYETSCRAGPEGGRGSCEELHRCSARHVEAAASAHSDKERVRENIRCLTCDRRVIRLDGVRWTRDADYMFYRNNYPIEEMLEKATVADRDYTAYCCQCRGLSTNSPEPSLMAIAAGEDPSFRESWKCTER